jgi:uncharacterized protein with von Willebrand factor type A (vWA) domain
MSIFAKRDYTLIIDKSGSMCMPDRSGQSRWLQAQESTFALARQCEQFDPNGITIYTFSSRFSRYDNVTADRVTQVFKENQPLGSTNLAAVLNDATSNYFQRKASGEANHNGETILVITDGEPDDRRAVIDVIIAATQKMDKDEELGISFIQVGNDQAATLFLQTLDDQLEDVGAKFDICDTVTIEEMGNMTLSEVLLSAILD